MVSLHKRNSDNNHRGNRKCNSAIAKDRWRNMQHYRMEHYMYLDNRYSANCTNIKRINACQRQYNMPRKQYTNSYRYCRFGWQHRSGKLISV